ncbi:MAG TPA: glycine cleavage system aminomethyltransferase GcvT [Thermoanaerobaculia bacterium]|nr:glycine cleavage system aminomethyltransferase GcvT [Thermoanaerobaculia bacterium]
MNPELAGTDRADGVDGATRADQTDQTDQNIGDAPGQPSAAALRRTPLHDCHLELGGRMVAFAGWEMPVQYAGVIEEHRAVRTAAGLFDVSHMGEIRVRGAGAEALLQRLTPNDVARLRPGRAHYSGLLTERGTYLDDLLVYRLGDDDFLAVVNASNTARDFEWMAAAGAADCQVIDESPLHALLALQGPRALDILAPVAGLSGGGDLAAIRYYGFGKGEVAGRPALISRTGYTGEDGFELYLAPEDAPEVWRRLLAAGAAHGLVPAGLGARDTLRLEAAMTLYGHEIDLTTTPYEAGLDWVVKLDKGDFVGREALLAQRAQGIRRNLVGFEVPGRGIARQGHAVLAEGQPVGTVTSGTWSPTLGKALGMAYVPPELAAPGTWLTLDVRGRSVSAVVVGLPFYRRPGGP